MAACQAVCGGMLEQCYAWQPGLGAPGAAGKSTCNTTPCRPWPCVGLSPETLARWVSVPAAFLNAPNLPQPAPQTVAFCGVFPEIKRAWASVDNSLFLWRFDKWCADVGSAFAVAVVLKAGQLAVPLALRQVVRVAAVFVAFYTAYSTAVRLGQRKQLALPVAL